MQKLGFVWQGITEHAHKWEDGLRAAIELLRDEYDIVFYEPWDDFDCDLLIYWEAPVTIQSKNKEYYKKVINSPIPKILLFAGGRIWPGEQNNFDAICIESELNYREFKEIGIDTHTAFGINTNIFKPIEVEKQFAVVHHGTCASWKRQDLLARTFKEKALIIGRGNEFDHAPFDDARLMGATVLDELKGEELIKKLCSANVLLQSSDYWGGGQRATLEAMACGLPVICMSDSPKNIEYVQESGAGIVCDPNPESIRQAYKEIMLDYDTYSKKGIEYVKEKWTEKHYADSLRKVIKILI